MSLTRNSLKALGIESDKIDAIVEGHAETVSGLQSRIKELEATINGSADVAGERDAYKGELDKANKRIKELEAKTSESTGIVEERDQLKAQVDSLTADIQNITAERDATGTELASLREQVKTFEAEKATLAEDVTKAKTELETFKTNIEAEKTRTAKRDAVRTVLSAGGVARADFQDLILGAMNLDDVNLKDDGTIDNAEALLDSTKTKYPSCFGTVQESGTPIVKPLGGAPSRITREDLAKMTPEQINANWERIQTELLPNL